MSKARLIKRREWLEQSKSPNSKHSYLLWRRLRLAPSGIGWRADAASRQPNARKMFAALFAQAPASYIETE